MSEEQLKVFLAKVKGDTTLQEKLKSAADVDAIVAIAKAAGFAITSEEFASNPQELSAEELEYISGGIGLSVQVCPPSLPRCG